MLKFTFFFTFIVFLLSTVYSFKKKDALNPLSLFVTPIFFQYTIYYLVYQGDYTVSTMTLSVYLLGLTSYVSGYFLFEIVKNKREQIEISAVKYKTNWILVHFCLGVGVLFLILTILYLMQLDVSSYELGSWSANLREAFVHSLDSVPFYVKYGKYFILFSATIYLYEFLHGNQKISKFFVFFLIAVLIVNVFSVVSRTDLLIAIMPLLVIWVDSNRWKKGIANVSKSSKKPKIIIFASIIVLFGMMNSMRTIDDSSGLFDKNSSIMQYLGKPIIAFDQWILPHSNESKGVLFIEPINKLLLKFELISNDHIKLASLGQFNVYSYLKIPYMEFGILGVLILMFLIGLLVNYLYLKSKIGSRNWLIFYSFYSYAIVMSFFDWQFGIMTYAYLLLFLGGVSLMDTTMPPMERFKNKIRQLYR